MNAPAKLVPLATVLALCAAVPLSSFASPTAKKLNPGVPKPKVDKLLNGIVEVTAVGSVEFQSWVSSHSFVETPLELKGRWSKNNKLASIVHWELHELGSSKTIIASGDVAPLTKLDSSRRFDVEISQFLPTYNTTNADKTYELRVVTQDPTFEGMRYTSVAKLVHKHKSSRTKGKPEDPFSCSTKHDDYERVVAVSVPAMTAHRSTSTKYEGADEISFNMAHAGPGSLWSTHRMPGNVDYAIATGMTVGLYDWETDDGNKAAAPYLYAGHLRHGEKVFVTGWVLEDDWDELEDTKNTILKVLGVIAGVGGAVGGPIGGTIAAVAGGVATVNEKYVPNVNSNDVIGAIGMSFENRCGRIQAAWVNMDVDVGGQFVSSVFMDPVTKTVTDTREVAMFVNDPDKETTFSPSGWDYGSYTYVGQNDLFSWKANGTSDSVYEFAILAQVAIP